jgi:DNA-binding NarL/FixJ family response regulator
MITVLVVSEAGRTRALDEAAARMPSLELLHAGDVEQALDRLARNRRIDAVLLLLEGEAAAEVVRTVLEEDPGAPPIFVAGSEVAGTRSLPAAEPAALLEALERSLAG